MSKFLIYAAVYVFLHKAGKIYLMRRANTGYRDGLYSLPAGHVELGETLKDAAMREIKEETGLDIEAGNLKQVHAMYRRYPDRTYADYFFVCENWTGEPEIAELEKCDKAFWADAENLPEEIVYEVKYAWECIQRNEPFSDITHGN